MWGCEDSTESENYFEQFSLNGMVGQKTIRAQIKVDDQICRGNFT